MNGQTGMVAGDKPVSHKRIGAAVLAAIIAAIILFLVIALLNR